MTRNVMTGGVKIAPRNPAQGSAQSFARGVIRAGALAERIDPGPQRVDEPARSHAAPVSERKEAKRLAVDFGSSFQGNRDEWPPRPERAIAHLELQRCASSPHC